MSRHAPQCKVWVLHLILPDGGDYDDNDYDDIARWNTVGWPHKIVQLIETTTALYVEEEEKFHKLQTLDQAAFNDRIDSLTVTAASLLDLEFHSLALSYDTS